MVRLNLTDRKFDHFPKFCFPFFKHLLRDRYKIDA